MKKKKEGREWGENEGEGKREKERKKGREGGERETGGGGF